MSARTVLDGLTAHEALVRLTAEAADHMFPDGVPTAHCDQISHELRLIEELRYGSSRGRVRLASLQIRATSSPVSVSGPAISIVQRGSGTGARCRRNSSLAAAAAMSSASTIAAPMELIGKEYTPCFVTVSRWIASFWKK